MKRSTIKTYLLLLLLAEMLLSYVPTTALAADGGYTYGIDVQIRNYLCAPTPVDTSQTNITNGALTGQTNFQQQAAFNNNNSGDLYKCINQLYKFAIVVAAVVGVFFIVIAGYVYMSADGSSEAVDKAKSIVVSTITSLVILSIGYIFLKAINPDLIEFHSIQPPSVTLSPATVPGSGGGATHYVLSGYDIGPYATAPDHERLVTQIYNGLASKDFSSAASIDQYLKSVAPNTPLTGNMIISSASKYSVDAKLMVALMQADSSLGTAGKGAATSNPGNVGNTDSGGTKDFKGNWQAGVDAVAVWLNAHRA